MTNFVVEQLFLVDLLFCFVQEYQDEETYALVSDIKKIAMQYLRGNFIFDLLAYLPFGEFFADETSDKARLYRLFKLLRLPRLKQLIQVENFRAVIIAMYKQQLI